MHAPRPKSATPGHARARRSVGAGSSVLSRLFASVGGGCVFFLPKNTRPKLGQQIRPRKTLARGLFESRSGKENQHRRLRRRAYAHTVTRYPNLKTPGTALFSAPIYTLGDGEGPARPFKGQKSGPQALDEPNGGHRPGGSLPQGREVPKTCRRYFVCL